MRICPKCKGNNVQELLLVWHRSNDGQRVHDESDWDVAKLYPEPFYCEDCNKTLDSLEDRAETLDEVAGGSNPSCNPGTAKS